VCRRACRPAVRVCVLCSNRLQQVQSIPGCGHAQACVGTRLCLSVRALRPSLLPAPSPPPPHSRIPRTDEQRPVWDRRFRLPATTDDFGHADDCRCRVAHLRLRRCMYCAVTAHVMLRYTYIHVMLRYTYMDVHRWYIPYACAECDESCMLF